MAGNQKRFYIAPSHKSQSQFVTADENLLHQLSRVLRLKMGDKVQIFDGTGAEYTCTISKLEKKEAHLQIKNEMKNEPAVPAIHLFFAPPKKPAKVELICEKAAELGVARITLMQTHFGEPSHFKTERLQKIMIEAAEQCGRVTLPELVSGVDFDEALQTADGLKIICDKNSANQNLAQILQKNLSAQISLLIGPEGGFAPAEITRATQNGFMVGDLGQNILRAETAAVAACAICSILTCQK